MQLRSILKEIDPLRHSLMGTKDNEDTQAERDFNKHHGGSMYGDHMGNLADKDTVEFDDAERRNPGKVEPYEPTDDKIKRGYEPSNSPHLREDQGPCWKGYQQIGMKKKDGKEVPNCVPVSEDINSDDDVNYGLVEPEEYDVEDEDVEDFIAFMRGYDKSLNEGCACLKEAEYQGRKVQLGKPMQGDVKKFKVYVKNPAGNVVKVNFGHGGTSAASKGEKTMRIRKSNPNARKSFRARHNCDTPGPRHKARYWSCRKW